MNFILETYYARLSAIFFEDKNILLMKPSLIYRIQDSIEALKEAIDLVVKYGYPNVLGDFRGLEIDFSIWSAIDKPNQWEKLGMSKNVKVGALFDKLEDGTILRINNSLSNIFILSLLLIV